MTKLSIHSPVVNTMVPVAFPNMPYHLIFTQGKGDKKEGERL